MIDSQKTLGAPMPNSAIDFDPTQTQTWVANDGKEVELPKLDGVYVDGNGVIHIDIPEADGKNHTLEAYAASTPVINVDGNDSQKMVWGTDVPMKLDPELARQVREAAQAAIVDHNFDPARKLVNDMAKQASAHTLSK